MLESRSLNFCHKSKFAVYRMSGAFRHLNVEAFRRWSRPERRRDDPAFRPLKSQELRSQVAFAFLQSICSELGCEGVAMIAMGERHCSKPMRYRGIVFAGMLSAATLSTALDRAQAQGVFDFLFGGYQQQPSPRHAGSRSSRAGGSGSIGAERVRQGAIGSGRAVAFCVRLCDGRQFPLERMANATPVETCHAMCPSSETKVFFGSEIGRAVAADGQRYTGLDTAFIYRKQFVAHCTCDNKDVRPGAAGCEKRSDVAARRHYLDSGWLCDLFGKARPNDIYAARSVDRDCPAVSRFVARTPIPAHASGIVRR